MVLPVGHLTMLDYEMNIQQRSCQRRCRFHLCFYVGASVVAWTQGGFSRYFPFLDLHDHDQMSSVDAGDLVAHAKAFRSPRKLDHMSDRRSYSRISHTALSWSLGISQTALAQFRSAELAERDVEQSAVVQLGLSPQIGYVSPILCLRSDLIYSGIARRYFACSLKQAYRLPTDL